MRIGLGLAGLIFLVSMLAAASVLLLVWLLRALWARLTGRPVQAWTFRFDRQTLRRHFDGTATGRAGWRSRHSDVVDADVVDADVTDVEPKRIDPPGR